MIVKYAREWGYKGQGKDPDFTLGKDYILLNITYNCFYKIHNVGLPTDSDHSPVVLNLECFDFIDERVPEGWVFHDLRNGCYRLQPQEFCGDFWDEFHDGDEKAEKIFEKVVNKIYQFHGMEPFYKAEPPKKEPLKEHEWWKEYLDEEKG